MTDSPILTLSQRIGRADTDKVVLCYYNDSTEWTPVQVQAQHADQVAAALTMQGMNVYYTPNTMGELTSTSRRGQAIDVIKLNALWADLDVKEGGLPSMEAAYEVVDMLADVINCRPTAIVSSGHGIQPYWEVEEGEISDVNRNFVAGVLKRWGYLVQRFSEVAGGKADSVYDLPRVLRAPGSINFKDTANPVQTSMTIEEWTHPVSIEEIVELVESYGFINENVTVGALVTVSPPEDWVPAERDCQWSRDLARQIDAATPGARHPWLTGMATKIEVAARNGCITGETYGELVQLLEAKFMHIISTGKEPRAAAPGEVNTAFKWARKLVSTFTEPKMNDNLGYHTHKAALYAVPDLPKESAPASSGTESASPSTSGNLALAFQEPEFQPIALADAAFRYTDAANAERLAQKAAGQYINVPSLGWYVWEGGRYVKDERNTIVRLAISSIRDYAMEDPSQTGIRWAEKSMGAGPIAAAIRLAESVPEVVVTTLSLDCKPLELCTPHGIVDLGGGFLRDADPHYDFNTRQTTVSPRPGAMPKFMDFLYKAMSGEADRVEYMQELFGVALIGEVRYHILPVFSGVGANGKSTLLDIAGKILGDYSAIMPENFLLDGAKTEHSTEIARLRGVRLAIASETRPDGKFNESRVKMLTAEPVLSARSMRQDFIDFPATHTLFLALNHPPTVRSGGDGFWRRIRKIDFKYQVPEEDRDPNLAADIVREEGAAILHWMIEGAKRVLDKGLTDPKSVKDATNDYREEEDHLQAFLTDCTDVSPEGSFSTSGLYGIYAEWCRKNGENPVGNVGLIRELRQRFTLVPWRSSGQRGWKGLIVYEDGSRPAAPMKANFATHTEFATH